MEYLLKPFVIETLLPDGSIRLGISHGRSFVFPPGEVEFYRKYRNVIFNPEFNAKSPKYKSAIRKRITLLRDELLKTGLLETVQPLNEEISERYSSQLTFFSLFDGQFANRYLFQHNLEKATVVILGLGGVGCHVGMALAQAGVGKIKIIDYDVISLGNLNRQVLYTDADIGLKKIAVASARLRAVNPTIVIEPYDLNISGPKEIEPIIHGCSIVICTADFPFHYIYRWINQSCVKHLLPWIQANSVEATGYIGPLIIPGKTACYGCIEKYWEKKNPDYLYSIDILNNTPALYDQKSSILAPIAGLLGNFVALETIRFLTNYAKPITHGRQISIDFGNYNINSRRWKRNSSCTICGRC